MRSLCALLPRQCAGSRCAIRMATAPDTPMLDLGGIETRASPAAHYALGVAQSFSGRSWRFPRYDEAQSRALTLTGTSPALAQILAARGVTRDSAPSFLEPRLN